MGFAGYITVCVQPYCVSCHCLTLHVSAYMAIFRCVAYFISICLKESASLVFFLPFFLTWSHSTRFHLWGGLNMRYYYLINDNTSYLFIYYLINYSFIVI
jgi:hypothetical protein